MSRRLGLDKELESGFTLSLAKLKALVCRLPPSLIRPSLKLWDVLEPLLQRELNRLQPARNLDEVELSRRREQPSDISSEVVRSAAFGCFFMFFPKFRNKWPCPSYLVHLIPRVPPPSHYMMHEPLMSSRFIFEICFIFFLDFYPLSWNRKRTLFMGAPSTGEKPRK